MSDIQQERLLQNFLNYAQTKLCLNIKSNIYKKAYFLSNHYGKKDKILGKKPAMESLFIISADLDL